MTHAYSIEPDAGPVDSPEWLAARRDGIGASEIAAVLGISPWETPLDVYGEKIGATSRRIPENLAYFGHVLEEPLAGWVEHKYPELGPIAPGISARSTRYPWLTATPDRFTIDGLPLELKTSSAYSKASWADGAPDHYVAQLMAQCVVLGVPAGRIAVLHGGNDPWLSDVIELDPEFERIMVARTEDFWQNHVLAKIAPEPTTLGEAIRQWPGLPGGVAYEADEYLVALLLARRAASAAIDASMTAKDLAQLEILRIIGDADIVMFEGQQLATYKHQKGRTGIDRAALERDHPGIAAEYTTTGDPTRALRVSAARLDAIAAALPDADAAAADALQAIDGRV